jgi:hypothetical protein
MRRAATRPLGVWVLVIAAFLAGTLALLALVNARLNPPVCHNCVTAWDIGYGEFLVGLFGLLAVSAAGVFFRLRWACIGLLATVSVYIGWAIIFGITVPSVRFAFAEHPDKLRSLAFWWQVSWPALAALATLALATWYLFSSRTSEYFSGS